MQCLQNNKHASNHDVIQGKCFFDHSKVENWDKLNTLGGGGSEAIGNNSLQGTLLQKIQWVNNGE